MASRSTSNPLYVNSRTSLGQTAGGFLDGILTPDVNQLITSDLDAKRRDLLLAQTSGENLKNDEQSRYNTSMTDLQKILTSGADFNDPATRAAMVAAAAGARNGLAYGPKFAAGAAGVIDPNLADLSTILTAGGVQTYPSTPEGQQKALDAAMQRTQLQQEEANARNKYSVDNRATTSKAAVFSPTDYKNTWNIIAGMLAKSNPEAVDPTSKLLRLDPGVQQMIMDEVTKQYMQNHNTSAAISSVLNQRPVEQYTPGSGWWDGEWAGDPTIRFAEQQAAAVPGAAPAAPMPAAPAPAAAAMPAPAAEPAAPASTLGPVFAPPPNVAQAPNRAAAFKQQMQPGYDNVPGVYKRNKVTGDVYQKQKDGRWLLVQQGQAPAQ